MERSQPRVISLMDTADQLLVNSAQQPVIGTIDAQSQSALNSRDKLHCVSDQLRLLLKLCLAYISRLHRVLGYDNVSRFEKNVFHLSMKKQI